MKAKIKHFSFQKFCKAYLAKHINCNWSEFYVDKHYILIALILALVTLNTLVKQKIITSQLCMQSIVLYLGNAWSSKRANYIQHSTPPELRRQQRYKNFCSKNFLKDRINHDHCIVDISFFKGNSSVSSEIRFSCLLKTS